LATERDNALIHGCRAVMKVPGRIGTNCFERKWRRG
jgi:hypothetical protein